MVKKRWLGLLLVFCFVAGLFFAGGSFNVTVSAASKTKKAYERILKNYSEKNHTFLSKDINGDGVKELFIWETGDGREYSRIYKVYTYSQGKAVLLGTVDESGWLYNKGQVYYDNKNHWIVTDDMGTVEVYACYGIKNKRAIFKRDYSCRWKDYTNQNLGLGYYMNNGKREVTLSKAKYNAYIKSLQKLSGNVNSKNNRKKYL